MKSSQFTTQSVSGLAAAHQQNVLHRDIKPANIMLDSKSGIAKIADFGLACTTEGSNLTQTGFLVGTPDFISPEQAAGKSIDHRSDLFSLGSVLYAMCCSGKSPFNGQSIMTILESVRSQQPISIETINPSVPVWFRSVVDQLLQKEPERRFESAARVLTAIELQTDQDAQNFTPRIDLSVNKSIRQEKLKRQNKYSEVDGIGHRSFFVVDWHCLLVVLFPRTRFEPNKKHCSKGLNW